MKLLPQDSPLRDRQIERVNQRYELFLSQGFATADFVGQPEPETLQCRNDLDRTNWLGLVVKSQLAIAQGVGDELAAGTRLRCSSNRMYAVTPNDALSRMISLLGMVDLAQQNWWRLKDLCRAEPLTAADLQAINLNEGWP